MGKLRSILVLSLVLMAAPWGLAQDSKPAPGGGGARERALARWKSLPPAQREELLRRYQEFKSLPPDAQSHIRANLGRLKHMSQEDRQAFRRKLAMMSPEERAQFLRRTIGNGQAPRKKMIFQVLSRMVANLTPDERQQLRTLSGPERLNFVRKVVEDKFAEQYLPTPGERTAFLNSLPEQRMRRMRQVFQERFHLNGPQFRDGGETLPAWRERPGGGKPKDKDKEKD